MTDTPSDPERPRRTLSLGIRRKPRPDPTPRQADEGHPEAPTEAPPRRPVFRRKPRPESQEELIAEPDQDGGEQPTAVEAAPRRRSLGFRRRARPVDTTKTDAVEAGEIDGTDERLPTPGRLRRERRGLIEQRQLDVYHLGGLAFELYRRDLLAGGVLQEKALAIAALDAQVRAIDAQLDELDEDRRARRASGRGKEDPDTEIGSCLTCRAGFRAEAVYCWRCGAHVNPNGGASEHATAVIESVTS